MAPGATTATRVAPATSPRASTPSRSPSSPRGQGTSRRRPRSGPTCATWPTGMPCATGSCSVPTCGRPSSTRRRRRWTLTAADGRQWTCDALVLGVGALHEPRLPDIEGLDTFAGEVMHTAQWPDARRGPRGSAGGGGRHRRQRRPADPRGGAAGRAHHRLPAHAGVDHDQARQGVEPATATAVRPLAGCAATGALAHLLGPGGSRADVRAAAGAGQGSSSGWRCASWLGRCPTRGPGPG